MKTLREFPLSALTCVVIWILSLAPIGEIELAQEVSIGDKWAHFIMYGGFCLVIWFEIARRKRGQGIMKPDGEIGGDTGFGVLMWTAAAPFVMSGVLELLQAYATSYRSGEWMDLVANGIGVILGNVVGAGGCWLWRRVAPRGAR